MTKNIRGGAGALSSLLPVVRAVEHSTVEEISGLEEARGIGPVPQSGEPHHLQDYFRAHRLGEFRVNPLTVPASRVGTQEHGSSVAEEAAAREVGAFYQFREKCNLRAKSPVVHTRSPTPCTTLCNMTDILTCSTHSLTVCCLGDDDLHARAGH